MDLSQLVLKHGVNFTKELEQQLELLAKEQPNFRYMSNVSLTYEQYVCSYVGPATANNQIIGPECSGCIFGQAFQRMGWTPTETLGSIHALMHSTVRRLGMTMEHTDWEELKCAIEARLYDWLRVQQSQDRGRTWSEAIQRLHPQQVTKV